MSMSMIGDINVTTLPAETFLQYSNDPSPEYVSKPFLFPNTNTSRSQLLTIMQSHLYLHLAIPESLLPFERTETISISRLSSPNGNSLVRPYRFNLIYDCTGSHGSGGISTPSPKGFPSLFPWSNPATTTRRNHRVVRQRPIKIGPCHVCAAMLVLLHRIAAPYKL